MNPDQDPGRAARAGRRARAPLLALAGLVALLVVAAVVLVPWRPTSPLGAPALVAPASTDFTGAQLAREAAFHAALRPPAYAGTAVGLLVLLLLGLTPLGARLVGILRRGPARRWPVLVVLTVLAVEVIGRLATLPFDARAEAVLRRYGLSTQGWASWFSDAGKSLLITGVVTSLAMLALVGLARALPRRWWAVAAGAVAALVLAGSFAYPLVIEPVFNRFTPMPPSALRTQLLDLAARDGVPVRDVLIADASRRTTSLNAYVSGFGATRRIVVYDTLLRSAGPSRIELIVAHELGHAKRGDVVRGTVLGAVGSAAGVVLLFLVLDRTRLLARARAGGPGDPRAVPLVLALVAVATFVSSPAQMLVSRRIEAAADVHSLLLTHDPAAFVTMQRQLAVTNLTDPTPPQLAYVWWASHPTPPQRLALARAYAQGHHLPVPPSATGAPVPVG